MDYFPASWGNPRPAGTSDDAFLSRGNGDYLEAVASGQRKAAMQLGTPVTHTQSPIMTGTSVLAIKYKDGIMMAGDTLSSYGSLARFRDTRRIVQAGDYTVVGATGEVSDYQHIKHLLEEVLIEEYYTEDGHKLGPRNIFEYLSRVMYNRRSNFNPLWNYLVVAGFKEGDKFLGYVDLRGTTYQASTIATGYGSMIAQPLLRKAVEGRENEVTEEEALKLLEDSMRILWYRDARAWDKIQVAKVTSEGVTISEPYKLTTDWTVGEYVKGYGA